MGLEVRVWVEEDVFFLRLVCGILAVVFKQDREKFEGDEVSRLPSGIISKDPSRFVFVARELQRKKKVWKVTKMFVLHYFRYYYCHLSVSPPAGSLGIFQDQDQDQDQDMLDVEEKCHVPASAGECDELESLPTTTR